jgi:hypothetical protein
MMQFSVATVTGECPLGYGVFRFVSKRFLSLGGVGDCARLTK